MKPKTTPIRQCDECRHFKPISGGVCGLRHKPRFVMPNRTWKSLQDGAWGWGRRCEDFDAQYKTKIDATFLKP